METLITVKFPIQLFSWQVLSPSVAIKRMDKSAFLHHGTGIPRDISFFFGLPPEGLAEPRPVLLLCSGQKFAAHFQMDVHHSRYRLFWKSDLSEAIKNKFPDFHQAYANGAKDVAQAPLMRLAKMSESEYSVELILADVISADIEEEVQLDSVSRPEGSAKHYYGKRYERDPANRRQAIAYHGLRCAACRFDFEQSYGVRGMGFIEIHHNKPLAATGEEQFVDPVTDLVPLCANCHRMIHRYRNDVISVEKLRSIINPCNSSEATP